MPLTHLIAKDGALIPIGAVDIRKTIEQFGLPPADIAAIVHSDDVRGRDGVGAMQITASQIGSGARQLYLQDTIGYAREPQRQMDAIRGTMRHAVVNCEHGGLLVEQRVTSKDGRFSMKYDSYVPDPGVLRDAKFVGYFKVLMVLKHGVVEQARDYVFQLNLGAILLRENGFKVTEMWLDFEPQGVGKLEKKELEEKFGITDYKRIPVAVPFLPERDVMNAYESLYRAKQKAMKTGTVPPMCGDEQTWKGKKCTQGWCPVAQECAAVAKKRGEPHPLNDLVDKLTRSLEQNQKTAGALYANGDRS